MVFFHALKIIITTRTRALPPQKSAVEKVFVRWGKGNTKPREMLKGKKRKKNKRSRTKTFYKQILQRRNFITTFSKVVFPLRIMVNVRALNESRFVWNALSTPLENKGFVATRTSCSRLRVPRAFLLRAFFSRELKIYEKFPETNPTCPLPNVKYRFPKLDERIARVARSTRSKKWRNTKPGRRLCSRKVRKIFSFFSLFCLSAREWNSTGNRGDAKV